jgi:probable rRNA maturation factor
LVETVLSRIQVEINNEQSTLAVDEPRFTRAVTAILAGEGIAAGTVSLAVVDDPTIHDLNRRFLAHDYPTDVLSFVLESEAGYLEGEVIVSADTAAASAARFGWHAADELLLYVIHGTLHLVGYDDLEPELLTKMRERERHYLGLFGLLPRYDGG